MESPEMVSVTGAEASAQAPIKKKRVSSVPRGPRRKPAKADADVPEAQASPAGESQGVDPARWSYVPDISPEDDWRPGQATSAPKIEKPSEPQISQEPKQMDPEIATYAGVRNLDHSEEAKPRLNQSRSEPGFNKNYSGQSQKFAAPKHNNGRQQGQSGHNRPVHPQRGNNNLPVHNKGNAGFNQGHRPASVPSSIQGVGLEIGELPRWERIRSLESMAQLIAEAPQPNGATINFTQHYAMPMSELLESLQSKRIDTEGLATRQVVLRRLMQASWADGAKIEAQGSLDIQEAGYGILVYARDSYSPRPLSAFVPACIIESYGLMRADTLHVRLSPPRGGESCPVVVGLEAVNGRAPVQDPVRLNFDELELQAPHARFALWGEAANNTEKCLELLAPIAKGQRGMIIAPSSSDVGSDLLVQIGKAILANQPDALCQMLVVDGRPEQIAHLRRQLPFEVLGTGFDQAATAHIQLAQMALERAKRLVEAGNDVVLLVDNLTRLARAFRASTPCNATTPFTGIEAKAMQELKRLWACAHATGRGGSLTILGVVTKDADNRLDDAILQELRGTANAVVELSNELVCAGITPCIRLAKLWNAYEKDLVPDKELEKVHALRRLWAQEDEVLASEGLCERLDKANSREAFFKAIKA
ncbi:MAG: hypothetical protein B7X06_01440 [Verrucomicrobia bacterium 21-51-4]|nr:MAG: hypothetical protein B7X06_01440 [Verrucomicrobia bacterium 21-51-4]